MTTFEESGKFSKAWWINHVKNHGSDGGMSHLNLKVGSTNAAGYNRTKEAIDALVMSSLIELKTGPSASGVGGRTRRYSVTTLGHRYLNEHRDQLEGVVDAPKMPPASESEEPVRHVVQQIDRSKMPQISTLVLKRSVATDPQLGMKNATEDPEQLNVAINDVRLPTPTVHKVEASEFNQPSMNSNADVVFAAQLRNLIGEIAIEKFAAQISAKDILSALENRQEPSV